MKIALAEFLRRAQLSGNPIAGMVTDLVARQRALDMEGAGDLSSSDRRGLILAFRHIDDLATAHVLFDSMEEILGDAHVDVCRAMLDVLASLWSRADLTDGERGILRSVTHRALGLCDSAFDSLRPEVARLHFAAHDTEAAQFALDPTSCISMCQCSDVHFGKYHAGEPAKFDPDTFDSPAYHLAGFLETEMWAPSIYLLCGDFASDEPSDLRHFALWAREFPVAGGTWRERVYVVPGNHDNLWLDEGGNDKLKAFREHVVDRGFRTPFGIDNPNCCRYTQDSHGCPAAVYWHPEHRLAVLLLVSSYYTGEASPGFVQQVQEAGADPARVLKLRIEEERGEFQPAYIRAVQLLLHKWHQDVAEAAMPPYRGIAVTHHNIYPDSGTQCLTGNGDQMRNIIRRYGFDYLLHGHTHNVGEVHQDLENRHAATIPCGSLSGKHLGDVGNSFNMLEFLPDRVILTTYFTTDRLWDSAKAEQRVIERTFPHTESPL